jgi:hypothetical protein
MEHYQHHNTKDGTSPTSVLGWKSSARSWHLNNISTKLELFSTELASQQHQHEAENLQHEVGITTTLTQRWKSSARGLHHNNINMKLEIFSTRMTLHQHHMQRNEVGATTFCGTLTVPKELPRNHKIP